MDINNKRLTVSEKIWVKYDKLKEPDRGLVALGYIFVPFSIILAINPLVGILYAIVILSWRHFTMTKLIKRGISN